jgi:hypothetical protein
MNALCEISVSSVMRGGDVMLDALAGRPAVGGVPAG